MSDLYFRNSRVRSQSTKAGMLLFHLSTGKAYQCNETAEVLWRSLDDHPTLGDLVAHFRHLFPEVLEETLTHDVERVLRLYESEHLVRRMEDPRGMQG